MPCAHHEPGCCDFALFHPHMPTLTFDACSHPFVWSCILVGGTAVGACASPHVNVRVLCMLLGVILGASSQNFLWHLLCMMLAVAVAVILCFGDADNATIGLMVMCGFVCAAGAAASLGGREYVSQRAFALHQFAIKLTLEQRSQRIRRACCHLLGYRHLSSAPPIQLRSSLCTITLTTYRCCGRHCRFHMRASQCSKRNEWRCRHECCTRLLGCWFASQMRV